METKEVIAMLTWVNRIDARVQLNESAVEAWDYAMRPLTATEAKAALLEHYRVNDMIAATPAAVRKRALNLKGVTEAAQRAIEAPATERTDAAAYTAMQRRTKSPQFRALFEEGRRQGNAERAARTERRNARA